MENLVLGLPAQNLIDMPDMRFVNKTVHGTALRRAVASALALALASARFSLRLTRLAYAQHPRKAPTNPLRKCRIS
jgi:hypothetical protein